MKKYEPIRNVEMIQNESGAWYHFNDVENELYCKDMTIKELRQEIENLKQELVDSQKKYDESVSVILNNEILTDKIRLQADELRIENAILRQSL